jgi:hypothetical protein
MKGISSAWSSAAAHLERRWSKIGCQMESVERGIALRALYIGWGGGPRGHGGRSMPVARWWVFNTVVGFAKLKGSGTRKGNRGGGAA